MTREPFDFNPRGYTPDDVARWLLGLLRMNGVLPREFIAGEVTRFGLGSGRLARMVCRHSRRSRWKPWIGSRGSSGLGARGVALDRASCVVNRVLGRILQPAWARRG
jgi:hypothetical protein